MDHKAQTVILALELASGIMLGRVMIPVMRRIKTGKFDIYIGDRYKKDGSEPRGGGAVILFAALAGLFASASVCEFDSAQRTALVLTVLYLAALTLFGLAEDVQKDKKTGIGFKTLHRAILKLALNFAYLALMRGTGFGCKEILLPFRWGYIDLGALYLPLTALMMTVMTACHEIHDCHKGIHDTGVDGLCAVSALVGMLGLAAAFSGESRTLARIVCFALAGGCAAFLVWGISPSKLYLGQSGGLLIGGGFCAVMALSGLHISALLCMLAALTDAACAGLQRLVFKKSKKLLFKGASLHEHLTAKGMGEYGIMAASAALQLLGVIGAAAFAVYESKLVI